MMCSLEDGNKVEVGIK
ncbi:hypothetical protein RDI58_013699 [Solanum bulbocastanum]|uniref:Uncharacterized protein n=1 Tax=Solanum bulbocastanum TaxID=147425 RepID=A0AAN8TLJ9_SOLBU